MKDTERYIRSRSTSQPEISDEEAHDSVERQGAGERHKLPVYFAKKIANYPKSLRDGQLSLLMQARETQDFDAAPPQNKKEAREQALARKHYLHQVVHSPEFSATMQGIDDETADKFSSVIEESGSIDELIVNCNLGLVLTRANTIHTKELSYADKVQEGVAGFMTGLKRYDRSRYVIDENNPEEPIFISIVGEYISGAIKKAKADQDVIIRVPQTEITNRNAARNLSKEFTKENDRPPTRDEWVELVAKNERVTPEKAARIVALAMEPDNYVSLDDINEARDHLPLTERVAVEEKAEGEKFSEALEPSFSTLTALEREIVFSYVEDSLTFEQVADRLGMKTRTVHNLYKDIVERLQVDPTVQRAWVEMGGNPNLLMTEEEAQQAGIITEKKRTVKKADALEYRIFHQKKVRLLDQRTSEDEFKTTIAQMNALTPEDRTALAKALLMKLSRPGNTNNGYISLQLLQNMDVKGIDPAAIVDRYQYVVEGQKPSTDPQKLLDAGRILAGAMKTDPESLRNIQIAWSAAIGVNSAEDPSWRNLVTDVNQLTEFLTRIDHLKQQGDIDTINQIRKGTYVEPTPELKDPHIQVFEKYLAPDTVTKFYDADPEAWTAIRGTATLDIAELTPEQKTDLTIRLVQIASVDDPNLVNQRDVAIELLSKIDYTEVDSKKIRDAYVAVVKSQPEDADAMGSLYSLYEAGAVLAPYFDRDYLTKRRVSSAWTPIHKQRSDDPEWKSIAGAVKDVQHLGMTAQEKAIVEAYRSKSASDVARDFGLEGPEAVYRLVHGLARTHDLDLETKKQGPKASPEIEERNKRIIADLEAGEHPKDIASREGISSVATVYTVLRRYEQEHGVKVNRPDQRKHRKSRTEIPQQDTLQQNGKETVVYKLPGMQEPAIGQSAHDSIADQEAGDERYTDRIAKKHKSK